MKSFSLQITYRKGKPFAAYIYLASNPGQKSVRTESVTQDLLIDYAKDGTPIGIEIISPGYVRIDEIQSIFDRLGFNKPDSVEHSEYDHKIDAGTIQLEVALTPDIERTLTEQARKLGITPEQLVVDSLKERFASASAVPSSQGTLADFLAQHIGVLDSREYIPGGARMSEDSGKKFAAGLLKHQPRAQ